MPTVMKKKQDAYNALESWMNQQPQETNSAYEGALDAAVQQLMGQPSFGSGYTAGTDPNVQAYRKNYAASLRDAANTAAAQTAALGGGYGTDYAASAAGQTAQLAAPQGYDAQQMLRQLASSGYKANAAANQAAVQALLADVGLAQSADQLNQDNWAAYRDILAGQAAAAADEELGFWSNLWNTTKRLAQAGMDIYDGVKGYQQQEFDNAMRVYEAAYGMSRDKVADEQYRKEQEAAAAYRAWQQAMEEKRFGLDEIAAQDDHAYIQAQIDAILQDTALAAQAAAAGYGGGRSSSGGGSALSDSERLDYMKALDEAYLTDSPMVPYYEAILGISLSGGTGGAGSPAGGGTSYKGPSYGGVYVDAVSGAAPTASSALPTKVRNGVSLAFSDVKNGATREEVMMNLIGLGYNDQEVAVIMNQVGW